MRERDDGEAAIRPLEARDRDAAIDLLWELNRFENAITGDRRIDREAAADCLEANAKRLRKQGGAEFVAELGANIVGYACAVLDDAPPYVVREDRRHAWLADLIVTETARGRGVGRALIHAAEAFARREGVARMVIGAVAGNVAAQRLYDSLGYALHAVERAKRL